MIDTFCINYKGDFEINKANYPFITKINENRWTKLSVVVKPSILYPSNNTSTLKDLESIKDELDKDFGERGKITRIDLATDFSYQLDEHKKIFTLLISCICYIRGVSLENIFKTNTDKQKNLKFRSKAKEFTVYSCDDKNDRTGNTRVENRIFNRSFKENTYKNIKKITKLYISELDSIEYSIMSVEDLLTKSLILDYKSSAYTLSKLHEFVSVHEAKILTRNILVNFLQGIDYTGDPENFINTHHKKRAKLKFVRKEQLKNVVKAIKKDMNHMLRF